MADTPLAPVAGSLDLQGYPAPWPSSVRTFSYPRHLLPSWTADVPSARRGEHVVLRPNAYGICEADLSRVPLGQLLGAGFVPFPVLWGSVVNQ